MLDRAGTEPLPDHVTVETLHVDLNGDLAIALSNPVDLVTTSALLDLVSANWVERMIAVLAARRLPLYAALSYDGRMEFSPSHPDDARVIAAVNQHQHGEKGFGAALGPEGGAYAIDRFRSHGFQITSGLSDWTAGNGDSVFQCALIAGWADAARDTGLLSEADLAVWQNFHSLAAKAGQLQILVGHIDFFAAPPVSR